MTGDDLQYIENPVDVDWCALHEFLHRAYAYMNTRINPPSSLHRLSPGDLQRKAENETLVLAIYQSRITGCMFCRREKDWLYVGKVAVDERLQGKGIGRQLFDFAFSMAQRDGFRGLELETRVELIENHQAFGKLGFVKVGENAHAGYDAPTSIRMRAEL